MYGIKQIGKYNVDYEGLSYEGNIPYHMVIIEEFDQDDKPIGNRKTFYFRRNRTTTERYIMPNLSTEEAIDKWMLYPNYSKFQLYRKTVIERI